MTNISYNSLEPDQQKRSHPSWIGISLTFAIVSLLFAYPLTRPCVIGKCQLITEAEQLATNSKTIQEHSYSEIIQADQQLKSAIALLESIPSWSTSYHQAQELLNLYQPRLHTFNLVLRAMQKGKQASTLAKNAPLSVSQWQEIQQLWQEAIDLWSQVSSTSEFYLLAQKKISLFQNNLAAIKHRLSEEQQAQNNLTAAQETAKLAQLRQSTAKSLMDWELVYASWSIVWQRLQKISATTTAYQPAQKILADLQAEMVVDNSLNNPAQFLAKTYQQALNDANLAQQAEDKKQWEQAVYYWRQSLKQLQAINHDLLPSAQVVTDLENSLKFALKREDASKQLAGICNFTQNCDYTITRQTIEVKLSSSYLYQIVQTAMQKRISGELTEHISSLRKSLQVVSNSVGIALEIYHPQGGLIFSYQPED